MLRYFKFYKLFLIILFSLFLLFYSVFFILPQKTVVKSEIEITELFDFEIFDIQLSEYGKINQFYSFVNFKDSLLKELKSLENIVDASKKNSLYNSDLFHDLMQQSFYIENGYLFFKYSSILDSDIDLIVDTYKNLTSNSLFNVYEDVKNLNNKFQISNLSLREHIIKIQKMINEINENLEWLKILFKENNISNNFFYENIYLLTNKIKKYDEEIKFYESQIVQNEINFEYINNQLDQLKINFNEIPIITSYSSKSKITIFIYAFIISFIISFLFIVIYDIVLRDFLKK